MDFWTGHDNVFSFSTDRWSVAFDTTRPNDGIKVARLNGSAPATAEADFRFFSLDSTIRLETPDDVYSRNESLVASYPQGHSSPHAWQLQFRRVDDFESSQLIAIEAVISLQTDLLDSHPLVSLTSYLLPADVRIVDEGFSTGDTNSKQVVGIFAQTRSVISRVAIVAYPSDYKSVDFGGHGKSTRIVQMLNSGFLEKGVIRRYRVLVVIGDDSIPETAILHHCQSFCESDLPLST